MRKPFLLFALLLLVLGSGQAQPCGISFDYDNAGNRIKRYFCWGVIKTKYKTSGELTEMAPQVDLEKMLETEIEQLEKLLAHPKALELSAAEKEQLNSRISSHSNFQNLSDMIVFPNPTVEAFSIQGKDLDPASTVSVVSQKGEVLFQQKLGNGQHFGLSGYPPGTYMVTLVHGQERRVALLVKAASK
ncbi:MAG: T9SS type A sorting domain-containing protein [Bacteroidota bacterium]